MHDHRASLLGLASHPVNPLRAGPGSVDNGFDFTISFEDGERRPQTLFQRLFKFQGVRSVVKSEQRCAEDISMEKWIEQRQVPVESSNAVTRITGIVGK